MLGVPLSIPPFVDSSLHRSATVQKEPSSISDHLCPPASAVAGKRTQKSGELELQVRRGREARSVPLEGAAQAVSELWQTLP